MPYPNRFSTVALYICIFIYFFTFLYSISLVVIACAFFIKSLADNTPLSLCDANLTNTSYANDTTACDVIYPVMYVSYIIIGLFAFLAICVYFALRCHEDFLSDGENYNESDLACVKKNNIDIAVLLLTGFFWVVLTVPIYAKCVLKDFATNCSLEIVFRLGCWLISNVGSVTILTLWVLFVFGDARKRLKEARNQSEAAIAKGHLGRMRGEPNPTMPGEGTDLVSTVSHITFSNQHDKRDVNVADVDEKDCVVLSSESAKVSLEQLRVTL